jgi:hypothetical protein
MAPNALSISKTALAKGFPSIDGGISGGSIKNFVPERKTAMLKIKEFSMEGFKHFLLDGSSSIEQRGSSPDLEIDSDTMEGIEDKEGNPHLPERIRRQHNANKDTNNSDHIKGRSGLNPNP